MRLLSDDLNLLATHFLGQTSWAFVTESGTIPHAGLTLLPPTNGYRSGARFNDVIDGTSNTICFIDASPDSAVPWTQPKDLVYDPQRPLPTLGRPNEDTATVAFTDGAARRLSKDLPEATWRALITRNGGETVDLDTR